MIRGILATAGVIVVAVIGAAKAQDTDDETRWQAQSARAVQEMEQEAAAAENKFPMPQRFATTDVLIAKRFAEMAVPLFDATLTDYQTARFKNVRAVKSFENDGVETRYFICGEVNSKTRMGGYGGWQEFMVVPSMKDHLHPDEIWFERELFTADKIAYVCDTGRTFRHLSDMTINYTAILAGQVVSYPAKK